ncbi:Rieske 2Fe-2S domain-containing protein, partial [Campylobacter coli]|nr:Rieske 2Fe-2S domain-containing protein [Campylobacter coli]
MKYVNDYCNCDIEKKEFEKLYKKFWIFGCHRDEIKNNKDYVVLRIYDFEIVIYNDNEEIIAFYNICPHRGARLLNVENYGFLKDHGEIKCLYHHWSYKNKKLLIPNRTEFDQTKQFD